MRGVIRWTPERLDAFQQAGIDRRRVESDLRPPEQERRKSQRSKYRSTRVVVDGIKFDSAKEARRWSELVAMQKAGLISDLRRQVAYELAPSVRLAGEPRMKPAIRYVADAVYTKDGAEIVEDTKSAITRDLPVYRIKKHLMATVHRIQIHEV